MSLFLRLIFRNRLAGFGAVMLGLITLVAVLAPILPLQPPNETDTADRFLRPLADGHLLGTDHLGRDMLSRLVWGTRLSLAVGFTAAILAGILGAAIGGGRGLCRGAD